MRTPLQISQSMISTPRRTSYKTPAPRGGPGPTSSPHPQNRSDSTHGRCSRKLQRGRLERTKARKRRQYLKRRKRMRRRFKKRWGLPKGFPVLDDKIRLSEILKLLTLILMSDEKCNNFLFLMFLCWSLIIVACIFNFYMSLLLNALMIYI